MLQISVSSVANTPGRAHSDLVPPLSFSSVTFNKGSSKEMKANMIKSNIKITSN